MMRAVTCFAAASSAAIPVTPVVASSLSAWLETQPTEIAAFVKGAGFKADSGRVLALPGKSGLAGFIAGKDAKDLLWAGALASALPEGVYRLEGLSSEELESAALAWGLGAYQFTNYKPAKRAPAQLAFAPARDTMAAIEATYFVRDLVNIPAGDLGPAEIEAAARELTARHDAMLSAIRGDDLLGAGLNLIHAVGRGSARTPRLIDITWGKPSDPKLTLVGKGVAFDTGGLDIKPSSNMILMKKDMGGAAHVLGLAHMIITAGLPVRLRVLVPAVENSISGDAYRPSDIIKSHKGLTVEIGNTDAEGRLVLADALSVADAEEPDLMIDLATLTGAARSALGPELPALFTDDDALANALLAAGKAESDPLWRMPLWAPYSKYLESPVADINNSGSSSFAGAITAALFLKRFVEKAKLWAHLDIYAWSPSNGPARSVGGEAQCLRTLYHVIKNRYS
ncbi:MAG: M17 family metallopeptidase [Alphaproteobacteria bacterium]